MCEPESQSQFLRGKKILKMDIMPFCGLDYMRSTDIHSHSYTLINTYYVEKVTIICLAMFRHVFNTTILSTDKEKYHRSVKV